MRAGLRANAALSARGTCKIPLQLRQQGAHQLLGLVQLDSIVVLRLSAPLVRPRAALVAHDTCEPAGLICAAAINFPARCTPLSGSRCWPAPHSPVRRVPIWHMHYARLACLGRRRALPFSPSNHGCRQSAAHDSQCPIRVSTSTSLPTMRRSDASS